MRVSRAIQGREMVKVCINIPAEMLSQIDAVVRNDMTGTRSDFFRRSVRDGLIRYDREHELTRGGAAA